MTGPKERYVQSNLSLCYMFILEIHKCIFEGFKFVWLWAFKTRLKTSPSVFIGAVAGLFFHHILDNKNFVFILKNNEIESMFSLQMDNLNLLKIS